MMKRRSVLVVESSVTGNLAVYTPYHAGFVAGARELGGKWFEEAWHFGPDRADALIELLNRSFPGWDERAGARAGGA